MKNKRKVKGGWRMEDLPRPVEVLWEERPHRTCWVKTRRSETSEGTGRSGQENLKNGAQTPFLNHFIVIRRYRTRRRRPTVTQGQYNRRCYFCFRFFRHSRSWCTNHITYNVNNNRPNSQITSTTYSWRTTSRTCKPITPSGLSLTAYMLVLHNNHLSLRRLHRRRDKVVVGGRNESRPGGFWGVWEYVY